MGRKSLKEPRRKEIIRAFYKIAKKEGLENASILKTANLIGITPSLIMHYFRSKEHLLYGLVEFILDKYLLIFDIKDSALQDAKAYLIRVIDNLFSNRWNRLFDDGVSYSCYSLTFRNRKIRVRYKALLDKLRSHLEALIVAGNECGKLRVENPAQIADIIFVLVDGAYYYLSLTDDADEYQRRLIGYKAQAFKVLGLSEKCFI